MPIPFPELSRKPSLKTKTSSVDGTLRDNMQNGAEATAQQWTRFRRQYDVTIEHMTQADVDALDDFVDTAVFQGAVEFLLKDERNPSDPRQRVVKFASLPVYNDSDGTTAGTRQRCSFTVREV